MIVLGGLLALPELLRAPKPAVDAPARLSLEVTGWDALDGWSEDDHAAALPALARSCRRMSAQDPDRTMGGDPRYGTIADWLEVCRAAETTGAAATPRAYFETHFTPVRVRNNDRAEGKFTGYYEAELDGSLIASEAHPVPLLARPDDLVEVDLGTFREHLKGERIAGRVKEGRLVPYPARAEIEAGVLAAVPAIVYVSDAVDAFFLHIQGSGRVRLVEGGVLRVGFAGQNGHPYKAIGKTLIEQGHLSRATVRMQSIRAWLAANPSLAPDIMNSNASYIFFQELDIADPALGPLGAEGLPLTPGRSLAVDRSFHALGVPMWLETHLPAAAGGSAGTDTGDGAPFRRLMIAQDTGGAIRGPVRGDVFFGYGEEAYELSGLMNQEGRFYVLMPKALAARLGEGAAAP